MPKEIGDNKPMACSLKMALDIVIADDEKGIRAVLEYAFVNYLVRLAENGKVALEEVKKKMPDVLLTDIEMPEMSGIELIKEVRKINEKVPIYAMSGRPSEELINDLRKYSAAGFFTKPFCDIREIVKIIKKGKEYFPG